YSYVYVSFRKGELSGRAVVIELSGCQGFCTLSQLKDVSKSITNNHLFCANRFCRTLPKGYSLVDGINSQRINSPHLSISGIAVRPISTGNERFQLRVISSQSVGYSTGLSLNVGSCRIWRVTVCQIQSVQRIITADGLYNTMCGRISLVKVRNSRCGIWNKIGRASCREGWRVQTGRDT